ncbi:MAG: UDP-3-O-(3-hydroxymyristoyl)glucosamine N-acyltransferase [Simkania sp.]|nr:UDP-3-O-(3-hydroxymyristoyl)glucosamine N-acyltransferase [Simkania sp.]
MTKKFTLKDLAELTGATLVGNPEHCITGVDALENAGSQDVSFLANPRYREHMKNSLAGAVCIAPDIELPSGRNFLVSDNPSLTFQNIAKILLQASQRDTGFKGIHPTAVIHPDTTIGSDVNIGPYVVIDQGTTIGNRTQIYAHVSIGPGVTIGEECILYPHSLIREGCLLGHRVILQSGAVIGSCGFGYATSPTGKHIKLEQLGIVVIEDDVEIGANTTIDRARFKETRIGQGTKIDNLVQIGHNVMLGADNLIVSQTGIAGSAKTGRHVIMGGQAGVVGHVEIADGVMIATRGGVSKTINKAGKYAGGPTMPLADYNRQQVQLRKIGEYVKMIEELQERLKKLEENSPTC